MSKSPYYNHDVSNWKTITEKLVGNHPLSPQDLKKCVLDAWGEIFQSSIGTYKIGWIFNRNLKLWDFSYTN